MTPRHRRRPLLLLAGLVLAAWGAAPSAARAACGDHVHIGGRMMAEGDPGQPPVDPGRPCHGPSCSEAPASPAVPPAPPSSPPSPNDWGLPDGSRPAAGPDASNTRPSEPAAVPVHVPSRVYHPPR